MTSKEQIIADKLLDVVEQASDKPITGAKTVRTTSIENYHAFLQAIEIRSNLPD